MELFKVLADAGLATWPALVIIAGAIVYMWAERIKAIPGILEGVASDSKDLRDELRLTRLELRRALRRLALIEAIALAHGLTLPPDEEENDEPA